MNAQQKITPEQQQAIDNMAFQLDKESYIWISENRPDIAKAVEEWVDTGLPVGKLALFAVAQTQRHEISNRIAAAARYLKTVNAENWGDGR